MKERHRHAEFQRIFIFAKWNAYMFLESHREKEPQPPPPSPLPSLLHQPAPHANIPISKQARFDWQVPERPVTSKGYALLQSHREERGSNKILVDMCQTHRKLNSVVRGWVARTSHARQ